MFNPFKRKEKVTSKEAKIASKDYSLMFTNLGWTVISGIDLKIKDYMKCYVGHVYKAINFISTSVEQLEWNIYKRGTDDIVEKTPYRDKFNKPNAQLSWSDLANIIVVHLEMTGDGFWYLPDDNTILSVPPHLVKNDIRDNKWLGYKIWIRERETIVPFEQMIHFKYPNPNDPQGRGYGTLQAAYDYWEEADKIALYKNSLLDNLGAPGGMISGGNQKTNEQVLNLITERHTGPKAAGKWMGVPEGFVISKYGFSPQELDLGTILSRNKEDVYQVFGVPQLLTGITESVNRSNMHEAKVAYQFFTEFPIAKRIQRTINRFYMPKDLEFRFKLEIAPDMEMKLKEEELDIKYGIRNRNEIRGQDRGLPPYTGGNTYFWQGINMPVGNPEIEEEKHSPITETKEAPEIMTYDPLKFGERSWKAFVGWQENLEKKMIETLGTTWRWIGKKTASNLSKLQPPKQIGDLEQIASIVLLDIDTLTGKFAELNNGNIEEAIRQAITQKTIELGITFEDTLIRTYLDQHLATLEETWKGIAGTDLKQLKRIIGDGLDEGYSMAKIAREINAKYNPTSDDFMNRWRANTIARTETATSANTTSHDFMEYAGVMSNVWSTAGDEKVRVAPFDHAGAEGETVGIKEMYYRTGEPLLHPSWRGGSAGNVISCRCVEVPAKAYQF